nr:uncharacterized mitochondrial protein AtMg00810-like [Tanacetum cinerariifolium]
MKVEESLNVTFDESPHPTKLSLLVDNDVGEKEAIKKNTKVVNSNKEEDESIEVDEIVNIKESKNHLLDQYINEMSKKFGLEDSKPTKTPMSTEIKLTKDDEANSVDSFNYRGESKRFRSLEYILNGDFPPVAENEVTHILEVVPFEEQSDDLKKKTSKNNEAKMVLYNALPKKEYERIFMCKTAKDI